MKILLAVALIVPIHGRLAGLPKGGVVGNRAAVKAEPRHAAALSDGQQLAKLNTALGTIQHLRSQFTANLGDKDDGSKFADGALSTELSKKDSKIWATLSDMLSSTGEAMRKMKTQGSKNKTNVMDALAKDLDGKAATMMKLTEGATEQQHEQDEEYLLGLLNMHSEWTTEQQLAAVAKFQHGSAVIAKLLKEHSDSTPLAAQLAALMDAHRAASKRTKSLLLQLAAGLRL